MFATVFCVIVLLIDNSISLPVDNALYNEILNTTFHPLFFSALIQNERFDVLRAISNSEEFNLDFPKEIKGEFIMSKDLYQGDIMLSKEQRLEKGRQGLSNTRYRWDNRRIPYAFASNYPQNARQQVMVGIQRWNQALQGCLILDPWRSSDSNWVNIINDGGCYSYVGKIGGRQALSLQVDGCTSKGTVVHEFMHASGIQHEQERPDRDNSITMHFGNIEESWRDQFEKSSASEYGIFGTYDYYSVMHYPRVHWQYSIDDKPAFTCKRSCQHDRIGNGDDFSANDIAVIKKMYNC